MFNNRLPGAVLRPPQSWFRAKALVEIPIGEVSSGSMQVEKFNGTAFELTEQTIDVTLGLPITEAIPVDKHGWVMPHEWYDTINSRVNTTYMLMIVEC